MKKANEMDDNMRGEVESWIDKFHGMKSAAQGFAEAAEFFRHLYHREHCFTLSCCRQSMTVKILVELEKGDVTKARIKELLAKANVDEKNLMDKLQEENDRFSDYIDLFVGCDTWEDCANIGNETCLSECGTSAKFYVKKA